MPLSPSLRMLGESFGDVTILLLPFRREGAGDSNLVKPSMEGWTGTWTPTVGIPLTSLINRN